MVKPNYKGVFAGLKWIFFRRKKHTPPDSSIFFDPPNSAVGADSLNVKGRLACKVLVQVLRRSGFDSKSFQFLVQLDNIKLPSYRVMVEMPSVSAVNQLQSKEIEHATKVELDIRHGVHVSTIYWRIKDGDAESQSLSEFGDLTQTQRMMGISNLQNFSHFSALKKYPAPIRVEALQESVEGIANTDREATPSELQPPVPE